MSQRSTDRTIIKNYINKFAHGGIARSSRLSFSSYIYIYFCFDILTFFLSAKIGYGADC